MAAAKSKDLYAAVKEVASEIKLREGHKKNEKVTNQLARDLLFFQELDERLGSFGLAAKIPKIIAPKKNNSKAVSSLLLSDLHFGSMLGPEVMYPYGAVEESRRLASVVNQHINTFSGKADKLNLYLLGDIIQNQLHDVRDGAPLAAQTAAAIHLLSQTIVLLASSFNKVEVYCTTGNHGRFTSRHKERATHQKWDSLEQVIYYSLYKIFEKTKNVAFHINKLQYVMHEVCGHTVFATHGDTVMEVGSPNRTMSVKGVEGIINRLAGSFPKKPNVFLCGHTHSPMFHVMGNGARLVMNGALVPSDEYSMTHGWFTTTSGQWGWLTDDASPVYDLRFLEVSGKDDKNATLNSIIGPYDY